ncbi:MAG TPA: hypothetical protein VHB99_14540, partial [Pirellulales bacterium]|nr:hypothetical protein [Pirellulales bacterium]
VAYRFGVHELTTSGPTYHRPETPMPESGLRHVIQADENTWELELPQEFLEQLSRNTRSGVPAPAYGAPSDPLPDAAPVPAQEVGRPEEPFSAPGDSE